VQLPGMDGFELHRRIVEEGQAAPVIFITAHPHEAARARARRADAVAFLEKTPRHVVMLIVGFAATRPFWRFHLFRKHQFQVIHLERGIGSNDN